jgi:hypothetical protein
MNDSIRAGYGMDRKNKDSSKAPDSCCERNGPRYCYEITRLRRELEELKQAVRWILPPSHGIHGGPLVCVQAHYEDRSEEVVITPHTQKMTISHENIEKARRLVEKEDEG